MKKITSFVVALLLLLPSLAIPAFVHAEDATDTPVTTTAAETKTETEAEKTARGARLEIYKKALIQKLTEATKTRVAARCVAAQALVKAHVTRGSAAVKARNTAYDKILVRLEDVRVNVGSEGVDNIALEGNIEVLKGKVALFKTAASSYEQSLTDLVALDCKTDPEAFKAALETARTDQVAALAAAKDIRTYLTDTVKPTLVALKAAVEANNNSAE